MKNIPKHINRFITLIVALQILNMGLFVQDFQILVSNQSSASTFISDNNVINSVVEFVSEVVLNKVNAIPEINSKSNKDLAAQKLVNLKLVEIKKSFLQLPTLIVVTNVLHSQIKNYSYQFCTEINPPPPKV